MAVVPCRRYENTQGLISPDIVLHPSVRVGQDFESLKPCLKLSTALRSAVKIIRMRIVSTRSFDFSSAGVDHLDHGPYRPSQHGLRIRLSVAHPQKSAVGAKAEMGQDAKWADSVENDPEGDITTRP
jgi:hypothetical protein